ncbi:MAG: alpha/beta hydrolase [Candidatus Binatia bacterium]
MMRLGRYDNPYKCVSYTAIDPSVRQAPVALEAADGGLSSGILYTTGRHKTVVCFMHPKADMSRHYAIPALLTAGYAAFGQNSRWLNNDELCVHENLLLDVAAGIRFLRGRGFTHVVVCGNSGGGSLYAFYQAQASTAPPGRLTRTPAGDALDLNTFDLPPADGYISLAAHLGEGKILMQMIDPSVTDESDPLSCDPALDPFNPDNGYRQPPQSSRYEGAFVERYRAAQRARVERLDHMARQRMQQHAAARRTLARGNFSSRPWHEQAHALRTGVVCPYMVIYRTEADLRALDLSLDPSERDAGTLFSYRPDLTNYMEFGFGRVQTPRAWLSTWSALSSNADVLRNATKVTVPSLVIYYRGDNAIFPGDARAAFDALAAHDKLLASAPGDHYGFGVGTQARTGAPEALSQIVAWLPERFPA